VVVAIGSHEVGQHLGVAGIGLRARDVVTLAVAGGGQGIDRVDLIVRRDQRPNNETSVFFNAHDNVIDVPIIAKVARDQRV
jgi:hypothetical protein